MACSNSVRALSSVMDSHPCARVTDDAVWIDSLAQANFLDKSFGIVPTDYPQLVVLSARKKRCSIIARTVSAC